MYYELQIAQREFEIHNAKYNNPKVVEGYTVQVPNVIDRAVMAVRALLAKATLNLHLRHTMVTHNGALAR